MTGFETQHPKLARIGAGGLGFPRGHILHDYLEARVMPKLVGAVGRGEIAVYGNLEDGPAFDPHGRSSSVR